MQLSNEDQYRRNEAKRKEMRDKLTELEEEAVSLAIRLLPLKMLTFFIEELGPISASSKKRLYKWLTKPQSEFKGLSALSLVIDGREDEVKSHVTEYVRRTGIY